MRRPRAEKFHLGTNTGKSAPIHSVTPRHEHRARVVHSLGERLLVKLGIDVDDDRCAGRLFAEAVDQSTQHGGVLVCGDRVRGRQFPYLRISATGDIHEPYAESGRRGVIVEGDAKRVALTTAADRGRRSDPRPSNTIGTYRRSTTLEHSLWVRNQFAGLGRPSNAPRNAGVNQGDASTVRCTPSL